MSYLDKYKVGSTLFRTLSEGRMRLNALRNALRHNESAPASIIGIQAYLARHGGTCRYEKKSDAFAFQLPETIIKPASARPLLKREDPIEFPETFVLRIPNGRVLGDGTAIVENNAILSETSIDFHRKQEFHHLLSEHRVPCPERFNGRLAVVTSPGSNNYFHWTLDSLPRIKMLQSLENEIDAYYVDTNHPFHREWIEMLSIPEEKIIPASPERHIHAEEVILPSYMGLPGLPSQKGLDFVQSFMPDKPKNNGRRIYISRSGARRRRILNEPEILPLLKQYGFETVRPGEMTVREQMETFASAAVVVAPHGAELTNITFCPKNVKLIELFSPYYLNSCFMELAAQCRLRHTALVGTGRRAGMHKRIDTHYVWANIKVDVGSLKKELESCA